jgi:hypothetical protein
MLVPIPAVFFSTLFTSWVCEAGVDPVCHGDCHMQKEAKSPVLLQQFVRRLRRQVPVGNYSEESYVPLLSAGFSSIVSLPKFLLVPDPSGEKTLAGFNPSLILLPPEMAFELIPGTRYAATVRHYEALCSTFGFLRERVPFNGSTVLLLDEDLNPVGATHLAATNRSNCQDVRLFVMGQQLLSSCVVYEESYPWHFRWSLQQLHLEMANDMSLTAHFGEVLASYQDQKNLGLVQHGDTLQVLWLLHEGAADVYTQPLSLASRELTHFHNNINPVYVPEEGAYLCVSHTYLEGMESQFQRHHYAHRFVLVNDDLHHRVLRTSPPVCFPSAVKENACETVQFVMSVVRDGGDLIIAYGINDCEAATVRVRLAAVLAFIRDGEDANTVGLQSQWSEVDLSMFRPVVESAA